MPELAADTDLPEEEWKQVKEEVDRLFDAFGEVDSTFHEKDGDKKAAYEKREVDDRRGVAALEAKLPLLGEDTNRSSRCIMGTSHDEHGRGRRHEHEEDEDAHDHE